MTRRALFRLDASPTLGVGHGMRCLVLADALAGRGWSCRFAVNPGAAALLAALAAYDHPIVEREDLDSPAALAETAGGGCDLLVVDHYRLDAAFERPCRAWAGRILAIDDLADRPHDADVLVDTTHGRAAADYAALLPPGARVLTGAAHALLPARFADLREEALARRARVRGVARVFVTLGGAPPAALLDRLIAAARIGLPRAVVDVAAGATTGLGFAEDSQVQIHSGRVDVAGLAAAADLALGAGGASSWQRCCVGLPTVLVEIADNQAGVAKALHQAGAALALGRLDALSDDAIALALRETAGSPARLHEMALRAAAVCDGRGAQRVADAAEAAAARGAASAVR